MKINSLKYYFFAKRSYTINIRLRILLSLLGHLNVSKFDSSSFELSVNWFFYRFTLSEFPVQVRFGFRPFLKLSFTAQFGSKFVSGLIPIDSLVLVGL